MSVDMELVYHSGDEYVPSFESDSLEVLVRLLPTGFTTDGLL